MKPFGRTSIPWWEEACGHLRARDSVMDTLIERHGDDRLRGSGSAFQTLLNAIVGQQISVAAAGAIWRRLQQAFPGFSPAELAAADPAALRAVGLSRQKADYVVQIALAFAAGTVDPASWADRTDRHVHDELTSLRGVGPWTADMVLIFHLHRPDVLPLGDIGLVNAAARLYGWDGVSPSDGVQQSVTGLPPESARVLSARRRQRLLEHAERWRPWRTVATWYIWRDLDAEPVIY